MAEVLYGRQTSSFHEVMLPILFAGDFTMEIQ